MPFLFGARAVEKQNIANRGIRSCCVSSRKVLKVQNADKKDDSLSGRYYKSRLITMIVIIAAAMWAIWNYILFPAAEVRFRISVYISDEYGNEYHGDGILGVYFQTGWQIPGNGRSFTADISGEAIQIDLENGRNIWMSLYPNTRCKRDIFPFDDFSTSAAGLILNNFNMSPLYGNYRFIKSLPKAGDEASLKACDLPEIIEFSDEKDPYSAKKVGFLEENYSDGRKIYFKKAVLTVVSTDMPITRTRIRELMPWLPEQKPRYLFAQRYVSRSHQAGADPFMVWDSAFTRRDY